MARELIADLKLRTLRYVLTVIIDPALIRSEQDGRHQVWQLCIVLIAKKAVCEQALLDVDHAGPFWETDASPD